MKTYLQFTLVIFLYSFETSFSQAPQAIPYQAVARGINNKLLSNQNISLRFSIRDSSITGTVLYSEKQNATTNNLGLFTANIGQGILLTGSFNNINWGTGAKFIQIEFDESGGNDFIDMGTQQMLSVPFALHANTANSLLNSNQTTGTFTMISNPSPVNMSFWEAMDYCHSLVESGFDDWRLPTYDEVKKYVEINGLANVNLITITQSENPGSGYSFAVLLDPANISQSNTPYVTTQVAQSSFSWAHKIQCVR